MPFDREMQMAVQAELDWEPTVDSAHIGVTAADGIVTLTGHVSSPDQKRAAEMSAGRIRGVRAIVETIKIILPSNSGISDGDIAAAAVDIFDWNSALTMGKIHMKVENGCITLTGRTSSETERQAAFNQVRTLSGVTGVINDISIEPRVDGGIVHADIMHALHQSSLFRTDEITVGIDGGEVRLSGHVASFEKWLMAAAIAHAAPGATMVRNDIHIGMPSSRSAPLGPGHDRSALDDGPRPVFPPESSCLPSAR